MGIKAKYLFLKDRPDKTSTELFIKETGIRASTIWHDRYISRIAPDEIAKDREISVEAIYEALDYCLENWESICTERDLESSCRKKDGFSMRRRDRKPQQDLFGR